MGNGNRKVINFLKEWQLLIGIAAVLITVGVVYGTMRTKVKVCEDNIMHNTIGQEHFEAESKEYRKETARELTDIKLEQRTISTSIKSIEKNIEKIEKKL